MAATEAEVKSIIKSILTSSPLVSTITTVQRDYRELVGSKIPFHELRYNSVEQFLKSIPDICVIDGTGPFAAVFPVLSEKSAHIDLMVSRQKVTTKRRSAPPMKRKTTPAPFRNQRMPFNTNVQSSFPSTSSSNYNSNYNTRPKRIENGQNLSYSNAGSSYSGGVKPENQNKVFHIESRPEKSKTPVIPPLISAIPDNAPVLNQEDLHQFKTNTDIEKAQTSLNNLTFKDIEEKYDDDSSNVPQKVQNNLKKLISQFEDGIWCSELPQYYKKMFKLDLLYMDYGYSSLIDMCIALKNIFHYVRPGKDDFKLFDRSKPPPVVTQRNCTISSLNTADKCSQSVSNPLPDLDWSDFSGYIPKDIFVLGNEIPKEFLPKESQEGDELDVVVVEVYDPSKFWIYFGTSDQKTPLDILMDDIQDFYNDEDNQKTYGVPPGLIQEGLYCVQIIYGEYHRAKIIKVLPNTKDLVKVFFIDYGTVRKVPTRGMCFLHTQFTLLPAQAVRCRLANIAPHVQNTPWAKSSSDKFRDLVNRRDTKIKVSYINWADQYICVFLADVTNPNKVAYINEVLVKNGDAVWEEEAKAPPPMLPNLQCKVQKLHLFPTFLELEYGLAPNAAEIYSLEDLLVPIQFCIPLYFESAPEVDEAAFKHVETCFIDTVKYHRKIKPLDQVTSSSLSLDPPVNFDIFGDLKQELYEFSMDLNLLDVSGEVCKEPTIDIAQITDSMQQYEPLKLIKEDMELSENIIRNLETLNLTDTKSLSQSEIIERELSSVFDDIDDQLMTKPVLKYNARKTRESIFDNPERFKDILSKNAKNPVEPNIFHKIVESLTKSGPPETTTQNNLLDKDNFKTAFNVYSNPFNSSSTNKDFLNLSLSEVKLEQELHDVSVDFKRNVLSDVKVNKMPVLCPNNPFYYDVENAFLTNTDQSLSSNCIKNTAQDKMESTKLEALSPESVYSSSTNQLDNVNHHSNSISTQTSVKDLSLDTTDDTIEQEENSTDECIVSEDVPKTEHVLTESVNNNQKIVPTNLTWWSNPENCGQRSQKPREVDTTPCPPSEYQCYGKELEEKSTKDIPRTENVVTEPVNSNQKPVTKNYTRWSSADDVRQFQQSRGVNTIPRPPSGYQSYQGATKSQGTSTSGSEKSGCSSRTSPQVDSRNNVGPQQQRPLPNESQKYFVPMQAYGPQPVQYVNQQYVPWSHGYPQQPQLQQWNNGSNAAAVPPVRPPPGFPPKNNNYYNTPMGGMNMPFTNYPNPQVYYPPPDWQRFATQRQDFYEYYNNYLMNVMRKQM
ncbi:uncharacterized protein LOC115882678 [Sitophilus oryzae]|uniref:Uncharacterized protein LOC115882678 n=1 Tax=Sitophilus oryzae TaxID=7048 RepID=A0A6J2Y0B0_SITOR|nr:uncharacterized protein LOC115882678 [Sitophilus oryzae]